ncbi:MAG: hypothetical protein LBR79_00035 [Oscillospiraceae bacterium]|nr:hypothetical protein [Oscillospiraceae bacterium]
MALFVFSPRQLAGSCFKMVKTFYPSRSSGGERYYQPIWLTTVERVVKN